MRFLRFSRFEALAEGGAVELQLRRQGDQRIAFRRRQALAVGTGPLHHFIGIRPEAVVAADAGSAFSGLRFPHRRRAMHLQRQLPPDEVGLAGHALDDFFGHAGKALAERAFEVGVLDDADRRLGIAE